MGTISIYTDGACSGNPGPGGWALVVQAPACAGDGAAPVTAYGHDPATTNNRMEVTAAIMALEVVAHLRLVGDVVVRTDSQLVVKGMNEWMAGWKRNGWRNAKKDPVANRDLWERLDAACQARRPLSKTRFEWLKGHAGHALNEMTDRLAVKGCGDPGALGLARLQVPDLAAWGIA